MAEQDQDRSEAATPFKLTEARNRGQAARSVDVNVVVILFALTCAMYGAAGSIAARETQLFANVLTHAGRTDWSIDGSFDWIASTARSAVSSLLPLFIAIVAAAAIANVAQSGLVFSAHPIKPDFDRVNPASGFKRMFSMRLLFETGKSALKIAVLALVAWLAIKHTASSAALLGQRSSLGIAHWLSDRVGELLVKLLLVLLVVGLLDFVYVRWDFSRRMRMSRRDLRDEHKQREGDPKIRNRIRELRLKFLQQTRAMRRLPEADILITNPTHVAVALSYRHGEMPAPCVLTKGSGELAARMREVARANRIPIVQNPPLARALFKRVELNAAVPEDLYPQIAKILIWVYAMRDANSRKVAA